MSPNDFVFSEATPDQRTASWRLNGASWAGALGIDAYIARELHLSQTPLSSHPNSKYWVLHRRDDELSVAAGCETTAKELLVADTAVRVVPAYAIASVFTDPQYRGKGLASHMLRELQTAVDGTTEAGALYSDIGRAFYTKLGWRDYRSPQVTFTLEDGFVPPAGPWGVQVSLLTEAAVEPLCDKDVEALTARFEQLARSGDGKTHISFLPSFNQVAWHFARDSYVAKALLNRDVEHRGAVTADGGSWLYWVHDIGDKKLKIVRLVTNNKKQGDIKALIAAALREASDWGLETVALWSPSVEVCAAATELWRECGARLAVKFEERESGSIPSLRWKGGREVGEVEWHDNEYFSWC